MAGQLEILTAIRELTNTKQLDKSELHGLLFDGLEEWGRFARSLLQQRKLCRCFAQRFSY